MDVSDVKGPSGALPDEISKLLGLSVVLVAKLFWASTIGVTVANDAFRIISAGVYCDWSNVIGVNGLLIAATCATILSLVREVGLLEYGSEGRCVENCEGYWLIDAAVVAAENTGGSA